MSQPQPPVPHAGGSRLTSHLVVHVATSYECSSNTWTVRTVPQRTGTQLHVHGYTSQVVQQVTSVPQPAQEPPWDPDAPWLRMQSNSVSGEPPGSHGNRIAGTHNFWHFTFQQVFSSVVSSTLGQQTSRQEQVRHLLATDQQRRQSLHDQRAAGAGSDDCMQPPGLSLPPGRHHA